MLHRYFLVVYTEVPVLWGQDPVLQTSREGTRIFVICMALKSGPSGTSDLDSYN